MITNSQNMMFGTIQNNKETPGENPQEAVK